MPLLALFVALSSSAAIVHGYPNVTLTSGDLAVTVYLPASLSMNKNEQVFYESSRFEHGSMIGSITRRKQGGEKHVLYGTDLWRAPHNPFWPESGVGLASEFGVGDDGDFCTYRCGWYGVNNITNGVLGYQQARAGDPFLKIGVGALVKGSCQACDITDGYKFNSPYRFANDPIWSMYQPSVGNLILEHEAHLGKYGYRIKKEITLEEDTLLVSTTLTNLGVEAFSTVWYSHHFYSCDSKPIGPGYQVEMDIKESEDAHGDVREMYEEPGVMAGWSKELSDYAKVSARDETVTVDLDRTVEPGTTIKAEFRKDERTTGAFSIKGCGAYMEEDIPELRNQPNDPVKMYGFNLYMERGTLSPEPQLLIQLQSSHSKTWTQRLVFSEASTPDDDADLEALLDQKLQQSLMKPRIRSSSNHLHSYPYHRQTRMSGLIVLLVVSIGAFALLVQKGRQQRRYLPIPDATTLTV
jgi:hypothetical protein